MSGRRFGMVACALALAACSGKSEQGVGAAGGASGNPPPPPPVTDGGSPPDAGTSFSPPLTLGDWSYWSTDQGLSTDIHDVSADEAGNVYVAGADALYAKTRAGQHFVRFDADASGMTKNCYDVGATPESNAAAFGAALLAAAHPTPPGPPIQCPVWSVAGMAPGTAAVGFRGMGTDGEDDADWATASGGIDFVAFDGTTLKRTRHFFMASPPGLICGLLCTSSTSCTSNHETREATICPAWDVSWSKGRRKLRQVFRIVVNHDTSSPMYGDVWAAGTHATFEAIVNPATAAKRGWHDFTADYFAKPPPGGGTDHDPAVADTQYVWEHDHPGILGNQGQFLTGYTHAVSIEPGSGTPWASNGYRTAFMEGYGADVSNQHWFIGPTFPPPTKPWLDLWPDDPTNPEGPTADNVTTLSHCPDGTLWVGSYTHGLVKMSPGGGTTYIDVPDPAAHGNSVSALACDPSDQSLWIGLGWGGLMRLQGGSFSLVDTTGAPDFTAQPPASIQIDRWSSPRVVYVAYGPKYAADGTVQKRGGVASYDGP